MRKITLGDRNRELRRVATHFRTMLFSYVQVLHLVRTLNCKCCRPPLPYIEVAQIVHQVCLDDVKAV